MGQTLQTGATISLPSVFGLQDRKQGMVTLMPVSRFLPQKAGPVSRWRDLLRSLMLIGLSDIWMRAIISGTQECLFGRQGLFSQELLNTCPSSTAVSLQSKRH